MNKSNSKQKDKQDERQQQQQQQQQEQEQKEEAEATEVLILVHVQVQVHVQVLVFVNILRLVLCAAVAGCLFSVLCFVQPFHWLCLVHGLFLSLISWLFAKLGLFGLWLFGLAWRFCPSLLLGGFLVVRVREVVPERGTSRGTSRACLRSDEELVDVLLAPEVSVAPTCVSAREDLP